jgi:hypothetical protein
MKVRDFLGDLGVDGIIIINRVLKNYGELVGGIHLAGDKLR